MSGDHVGGTVELLQAFLWTCDACGRDNFERAITVAPEAIHPSELPQGCGMDSETLQEWLESGGGGDWVAAPARVKCRHCGAEFGTAHSGE